MENGQESKRLKLDNKLRSILGSNNVYFQPPETVKMTYPAIVYDLYRLSQRFADDYSYKKNACYSVTVIDRHNDVNWLDKILDNFSYCSVERVYVADNLNHYSFIMYI